MKLKIALLLIGLVLGSISHAQIKIGTNPQNINASSVLELESTSRTLVLTRVNSTQMNAIRPLQGALVYNTETKCVHYYDGTQWLNICDALTNSVNISLENNGDGSYTFTDALGVQTTFTITSNATFEVANDSLVLTDSNNNALSVALDSLNRHTYSTDAIVNVFTINNNTVTNDSTIVIRRTGNNYNFEVGEISGLNIRNESITRDDYARGSINGLAHIQAASILQSNLATGSVGSAQILANSITLPKLAPGTIAGQLMQWNGSNWVLVDQSTLNITESDGIVGNEVLDATDNTLVRSGTGTTADPYTLDVSTGGINTPDIAANAIGTPQLANNAVNSDIILDGEVRTTDILNETILSEDILNGTIASVDIADDAVTAAKINIDVVGTGLIQNATTGALEVDPTTITGDGNITSTDINVTGGAGAAFNDVTLTINDDAVSAAKINADVAGSGLLQNTTTGALEVDPTTITGDGNITSTDINVTGGTGAAFNDVTLTINDDAVSAAKINADVAGSGLLQNTTTGALEVDPTTITGDGNITSTDINVTGGAGAAFNDVTLTINDDAVSAAKINGDVAGSGLLQNTTTGALEVDPTTITGDGNITSTDINVTGGTGAAFNDVTLTINDDAVSAAKINGDVAGSGLLQNTTTGALEVDPTTITGDGNITSTDINVTGGTGAAFNDVTLTINDDAVSAAKINGDVAGSGLLQNTTTGALEVDPTTITGDGNITSTDINVTGGTGAAFNDVTLTINDDAVSAAKINADVAGSGLLQNTTTGALEVDPTTITGDGNITSTDINVTGGTGAAFNDVTLTINDDAVSAAKINADVAGSGLLQNTTTGALEIEPSTTEGQILKTVGGTATWANQFHAIGKMNADVPFLNAINVDLVDDLGTGNYRVNFTTDASSNNYVIQLTLLNAGSGATIEVTNQQIGFFEVQISSIVISSDPNSYSVTVNNNTTTPPDPHSHSATLDASQLNQTTITPIDATWYFTVTDF